MRIYPAVVTNPVSPLILTANEWAAIRGIRVTGQDYAIPAVLEFDRNAFMQRASYSADLGNHALTVRLTYAMPAGYEGILDFYHLYIRGVPATDFALVTLILGGIQVDFLRADPAWTQIYCPVARPGAVHIRTGDTLLMQTTNASATTLFFQCMYRILVFAA